MPSLFVQRSWLWELWLVKLPEGSWLASTCRTLLTTGRDPTMKPTQLLPRTTSLRIGWWDLCVLISKSFRVAPPEKIYTRWHHDRLGFCIDTTGNMGKLGKFLHDNGHEHAYCTDHVFHLTAILALFSGKLLLQHLHHALLPVSFYMDSSHVVVSVLLLFNTHLH